MSPDVLLGQEFVSQTSVNNFLAVLNSAAGSPGDWAAAPFVDGPDTDSAFFYRTSKVVYLATRIISFGASAPEPPRNSYRYDFRPVGISGSGATIAAYNVHMKSGSTSADQARRLVEAERIRRDAEQLPQGTNFLIAGDFNIQSSNQAAYQELVGSKTNNAGRFFDPIKTPGSWNNSSAYRFVHTQDPATQMDDRLDFILTSENLVDGGGFHYIGNPNLAYSTTTWNDPNHSYRVWGNDGTSFDTVLTVQSNSMVGPQIAQALIDVAQNGGHLPVFLDSRVPATVGSTETIDFGTVPMNAVVNRTLQVWNDGNVSLWTANGIASLNYTLSGVGPAFVPSGNFADFAGGGTNGHTVTLNTNLPGWKSGTITILSNDPGTPARIVPFRGRVLGKLSSGIGGG